MGKRSLWFGLIVLTGSCAPTAQDRAHGLTQDGMDLYRRGAFADARDTFRAAVTLRPDDPDLHYQMARCSDRMGQAEAAERQFRDCLERDPDHAKARHGLAVVLVRRGRRDEAVTMAEDWLRARPQLAGPYALDGWLRAEVGDYISARARYQQALNRDPLNVRALVELARVYEQLHYPDRALVLYERSLGVSNDQPEVRERVEALKKRGTRLPQPD